jgi:xylan 1,4-beta-xylosidase
MIKYLGYIIATIIALCSLSGNINAQDKKEFSNPILSGFYPDPSICRVGDNYYLINSTFAYYPGINVMQSKDLVNWKIIGYALSNPETFNLDGAGVSRGLFAPTIRYHDGIYYITCTLVDKGGNFVVTAKDPAGPWSDPVWLPEVNGIDPSLFFDNDGKAYLIYNSIPPDNKPLYDGHRTIRIREFDYKDLKVMGEEEILVNGGTDITQKPVWIEAPHIFRLTEKGEPAKGSDDGYYYLICAQGGTAYDHSEVVFRSKNVYGPYVSYKNNPILTQRNLKRDRKFAITSTGHADFVQTLNDDWWAVFLGCRPYPPYEKDFYNTGRETFLAPVKWIDGWPIINPGNKEVQYFYPYPLKEQRNPGDIQYNGNLTYRDDFNSPELDLNWMFLRIPHEKWYSLSDKDGYLSIKLLPETCTGNMNPAFLAHRQQNLKCSASSSLLFNSEKENEKAGLVIFMNEHRFYYICKSSENGEPVVQLFKSTNNQDADSAMQLIASVKLTKDQSTEKINFKIVADNTYYSFFYSFEDGKWIALRDNLDAAYIRAEIPKDFVGAVFAMYATSLGKPTINTAYYDWFEYKGNDDVYK